MSTAPDYLQTPQGRRLAYFSTPGKSPGVMFMGGFRSDMTGAKANALEHWCRQHGHAFLRFDYSGHGLSSGRFEEGSIGDWLEDAQEAFDNLTSGKQILVGSSLGGWIALLLASSRSSRIKALVTVACAADFTERLLWENMDTDTRQTLLSEGMVLVPSDYDDQPYPITHHLIDEGRKHLLLDGPINLNCPISLLHGLSDKDVPWQISLDVTEQLIGHDVELTLIKRGDHRMSSTEDLQRLCATVAARAASQVQSSLAS